MKTQQISSEPLPACAGSSLTAIQRVLSGQRRNWRIGQLIAFVHGPGRENIYRFRVTTLGADGRPSQSKLVGGKPWKNVKDEGRRTLDLNKTKHQL